MPRGQAGRVDEQNWWGLRGEAEEHTSRDRAAAAQLQPIIYCGEHRPVLPELQIFFKWSQKSRVLCEITKGLQAGNRVYFLETLLGPNTSHLWARLGPWASGVPSVTVRSIRARGAVSKGGLAVFRRGWCGGWDSAPRAQGGKHIPGPARSPDCVGWVAVAALNLPLIPSHPYFLRRECSRVLCALCEGRWERKRQCNNHWGNRGLTLSWKMDLMLGMWPGFGEPQGFLYLINEDAIIPEWPLERKKHWELSEGTVL